MIRTLFVLFFSICVCHADTVDKHTQQTSEYGDEGKFGGGDPGNTNALILWSHDSPSIVRRHRPGGHSKTAPKAFKLWSERGAGGFPVNLKNEDGFCSFLSKIDREPDLYACICDDTGAWDTGSASSCSPAVALPQCTPVQCEPGSTTPIQQPSCTVTATGPLKPIRYAPAMTSINPVPWPIAQSKHRPPREPAPATVVKRHGVPTPPWSAIQCGSTRPA